MQTVTFRDTLCIISFVPQPVSTLNVSCACQGLYTFLQKCIQQIKSMALINKTYLRVAQNIQVQCVPVAIMQARVRTVWHWPGLSHCTNNVIITYKLKRSHKGTGSEPFSGGK